MNFGSASWGFREEPLEKQLQITKELGLSTLELGIANAPKDLPLDISDAELADVKALYAKYGIELTCAATGNDFTNGNMDDVAKIKRVIDICETLGVKYLRIFAGFSPVAEVTGAKWDTMIAALQEVYAYADTVIPVVETHGGVNGFDDGVEHFASTTTDVECLQKMIAAIPELKINYDPANLYAVGVKNPDTVYQQIKDHVCYVHLKDFATVPGGHLRPSACGESDMDWTPILASIKNEDYPMLFEYENTEDIRDGLERSYDYIKKELLK